MAAISRACRIRNPALFICDLQEKFRAIYEFPKLITTTTKLLKASSALNIPVYVTTQNRPRLGDVVSELQPYLSTPLVRANIDKTLFSMITPELDALLPNAKGGETPLDVIIVGIETHICITQTTLDLLERGHRVYVIVDGVSSMNKEERGVALARLRDAGAIVTSSEGILFEILGDAGRTEFKAVSGLVRETKEETREAMEVFSKI
ncbi:putative isochorismatase family hydrolase [Aspergillus fischeri NRRL 181]|uniref:Isochorismatase family hydrolase, putative n=1 Tax=Neosartorya fischeri (strain ATCC 1020 / DSM 3700 / CBS 544.65 / FGSC A1164 / JCM 1740 / NRRL 181 / WB 181) TaxID=331117 RepID=A1DGJ3_NEOFI|nr:isochorismatase family hydrolase, putative [Aspergillus fischeri NRRL 181]EAW18500.1 isochorismatase family hydrolase, putative [Aspergillus fischeri NRRL 181]